MKHLASFIFATGLALTREFDFSYYFIRIFDIANLEDDYIHMCLEEMKELLLQIVCKVEEFSNGYS